MLSQELADLPNGLLGILILAVFLVLGGWNIGIQRKQRYAAGVRICGIEKYGDIKKAREGFRTDAKSMLAEGYEKSGNRIPFYVPSPLGERLMIPGKYVEELKTAAVRDVDFVGTFFEMFEGKYTTMGSRSTLHPRVARKELNHHLDDVLPAVNREIRESFETILPACEDWTEVLMGQLFVDIVARVSSRMFGGVDLSQNQGWINSTIKFAEDGFIGAQKIKGIPLLLRPLIRHFIPELRSIERHHSTARRVIVPLLEEREDLTEKPSDFLQWMYQSAVGSETDKAFIASIQLKLSFAAIHTSAAAPTQLLYDLCAMPRYIEPMREEVQTTLAEHGSWTKQSLSHLKMLDSFMKESQRFNPLLLITFERLITRDYPLSDGFVIPKGTTIGVPTQAISMDPDLFDDPETFDAFRFVKLRDGAKSDTARFQYAASTLTSMAFGYGRHACPGRFFASNEIKMIMAYLLLNYDFEFPEGQTERPASLPFETQYLPNPSAKVLLRKRSSHLETQVLAQ